MRNLEIRSYIMEWAKKMVKRFNWLTVRFEYSDTYQCYLVSFYYSRVIEDDNPFFIEAISFEDKMNELFLDNAPLFCDEERLFKLSADAETVGSSVYFTDSSINNFFLNEIVYIAPTEYQPVTILTDENYHTDNNKYEIAA